MGHGPILDRLAGETRQHDQIVFAKLVMDDKAGCELVLREYRPEKQPRRIEHQGVIRELIGAGWELRWHSPSGLNG